MTRLPTGVVTFLFTDIEGSTQLWAQRPNDMRLALERHDSVLRAILAERSGHVFATAGDSFAAAFQQPADAVGAAIAIQQALARTEWPTGLEVRVRMGLHVGVAHEREGNYFGSVVNLAARVEEAAHGGQIVITETLSQHLRGQLVEDLGEHRLRGFELPVRLLQVDVAGVTAVHPPLRTESQGGSQLPSHRPFLIGRDEDAREVRTLLTRHRLVTLTGAGGVGKTSLALEIASRELTDGGGSVFFLDLSAVPADADVSPTLSTAFGLPSDQADRMLQHLVAVLAGRSMLLVVDNCEQVLDSIAHVLHELLNRCEHLRVLATSREALSIAGERIWRVPSLPLLEAAVPLFEERARECDSSFVFGPATEPILLDICRRIDGIPLAIELAASRVRTLSLADIRDGLDDRFRLLTSRRRDVTRRQQTLENVISWSYDLLLPQEQSTLQRLAVFSEGFALRNVVAVAEIDEYEAIELIDSFAAKSLVDTIRKPEWGRISPSESTRYRLSESLRSFALDRLQASGDARTVRDRHLEHYLEIEAAPQELRVGDVNARVQIRDFANVRAAANWALASDRPMAATRLTIGRAVAIAQHGAATEGLAWLAGRDQLGLSDHLWALNGCAFLAMAVGDREQARAFTAETFERAADQPLDALPNAYVFAAMNTLFDGEGAALALIDRAIALVPSTPSGDEHLPAVHHCRSLVLLHDRRWAEALIDATFVQTVARAGSPYRGEAQLQKLAALAALDRQAEFESALEEVARPASIRVHEWCLRLFDLLRVGPKTDRAVLRRLALDALAMSGGDPLQRGSDLLAVLAWRADPEIDALLRGDYGRAGVSNSPFGALAMEAIGRRANWVESEWFANRAVVGGSSDSEQRKAAALRTVTALSLLAVS